MRVRDIMTSDVSSVEAEATLRDTVEALREWEVAGAPVVRGTEVVGVVSAADVLEFQATSPVVPAFREEGVEWGDLGEPEPWDEEGEDAPALFFVDMWIDAGADVRERMASIEGPEWDHLAEHQVGEVMSRKILSVGPNDDVRSAASRMTEAGVHRILVLEEGRLVGLVSASDIVRAVGENRL